MVCLACSRLVGGSLCGTCELSLRPGPELYLGDVGVVRSAFCHRGAARLLVHHLKYRGVVAAGDRLAEAMAPHVPGGAVLVPVPRVGWRRLRYGVDPAVELAKAIGKLTGRPVARPLVAPFWGRARAGGSHGFAPRFRLRRDLDPNRVLLVDDVVTTGATLMEAARLFPRVEGALTATSSGRVGLIRAPDSELTSVAGGGHHRE